MTTARSVGDSLFQKVELSSGQTAYFDEPEDKGGTARAPNPVETLGAALASCTANTLRLYADRKEWDMTGLEVEVTTEFERYAPSKFTVDISYPDGLNQDQLDRLRQIAQKCPVHKALARSTPIEVK